MRDDRKGDLIRDEGQWRNAENCAGIIAVIFRGSSPMNRSIKTPDVCPCGSALSYVSCCGRWHRGERAPSAEALMRSRYAAFVLRNEPYLLQSWHPSTRPSSIAFDPEQKWLGLKIVDATEEVDAAEVEFIARFRIGGASAARLHERSRFVREGGRWLYVDGSLVEAK
jgi:SEC-C motif domain protein